MCGYLLNKEQIEYIEKIGGSLSKFQLFYERLNHNLNWNGRELPKHVDEVGEDELPDLHLIMILQKQEDHLLVNERSKPILSSSTFFQQIEQPINGVNSYDS